MVMSFFEVELAAQHGSPSAGWDSLAEWGAMRRNGRLATALSRPASILRGASLTS